MAVQSNPAGWRQKETKTEWPIEEGLNLGTNKLEGREIFLVPEEATVRDEFRRGL